MEPFHDICTCDLKEVLLLELLEDGRLDLDKLIGHEQREKSVGVRVDSDVQGNNLIEQGGGVHEVIRQCEEEKPERALNLAASVGFAFECFTREKTFQNVLTQSGEKAVEDLNS